MDEGEDSVGDDMVSFPYVFCLPDVRDELDGRDNLGFCSVPELK
jgi:hypothetical protein